MKIFISFVIGAAVGSALTYIYLKRKEGSEEFVEAEIVEEEEDKPDVVVLEPQAPKAMNVDYSNLVSNMYTKKPRTSDPYIISEDQYHESHPEYEKVALTYYAEDGSLANYADLIDDTDYTIGLRNLAELDEEHDQIFVRNEGLGTDYIVDFVNKSYADDYPDMTGEELEDLELDDDYI